MSSAKPRRNRAWQRSSSRSYPASQVLNSFSDFQGILKTPHRRTYESHSGEAEAGLAMDHHDVDDWKCFRFNNFSSIHADRYAAKTQCRNFIMRVLA